MESAARKLLRVLAAAAGAALVIIGVALLALPGPGLLVVALGLALISWQFPAVARLARPVKVRALASAQSAAADPVRFAGLLIFGAGLVGLGVAWATWDALPLSGPWVGGSLALAGVILLATSLWARRTAPRGPTPGPA